MRLREAGFWPLKPIRWLPLLLGVVLLSGAAWLFSENLIEHGAVNLTVAGLGGMALVFDLISVAEAIWQK